MADYGFPFGPAVSFVFGAVTHPLGEPPESRSIAQKEFHQLLIAMHDEAQGGYPAPRPQRGRPRGWAPSSVRDTLTRPLYRGTIVYGRSAKAYGRELAKFSGREKGQIRKPEGTWLHIDAPHLRIVSEELVAVVDVQRSQRRARYLNTVTGKLLGPRTSRRPALAFRTAAMLVWRVL